MSLIRDAYRAEILGGLADAGAAATRQPGGTLLLRSDRLTPAELADEVLATAGR